MTPAEREGLRLEQQRLTLRLRFLVAGAVLAVSALWVHQANARWKAEYGSNSPEIQSWFKDQHNAQGQWCCDESDGHPYFGDWKIAEDGSVTVTLDGKTYKLPAYMVLKGPNPTGHAVWWYSDAGGEHRDYCFAPGTLS